MPALTGLRIVELAEAVAGEYCGRLLADFGAQVIKVERPRCGSPTRSMGPIVGDGGPDGAVPFGYLNTDKCSVVLDVVSPDDNATLHELVDSADAVIDDHAAPWAEAVGVSQAQLAHRHPSVVFCSVTPYGREAPPEWQNARSLNVFHSSGWGYHTPSHADPAAPPLKGPGRHLVDFEAGLDAALCVTASLLHRLRTGHGEFIDVSEQAVMVSRADCILGRFITGEIAANNDRDDYDQQGPASFFACRDGFVYLYMTSRKHWIGVKELMGQPDWLEDFDDNWLEFSVTGDKVAAFRRGFAHWVRAASKGQVTERAQRLGVPLVPVNDATDLWRSPQYRHRGFFCEVTHPVLGTATYPTVPYKLGASPARITSAAPHLGQHTAEVLGGLPSPRVPPAVRPPRPTPPTRARGGPLQGIRVVELTKVWAGPYAGKLLAFLGAEVIKVETSDSPEEMRAYGGTDINHAPFFLSINPEILSVDLDITSPVGRDRLRRLIARSDIVLNNLRPGAMERQGLGYEQLAAIRSDIISVSVKMWGNDGPLGYQTGYAPCFAALAGLACLVGYPGGPPLGANMRYGDSTVGAAAAFAAVAALLHRDLTGEGQFVDVSAVETLSSMIGDCLVEHSLGATPFMPDGNRHPDMSPHGCYPCARREWVSIAVAGDTEWRRLCAVLGGATLADDPRYATLPGRHRNAEQLDRQLGLLTAHHDAADLAQRLRATGVPASKSANATDVISDHLLWERDFYRFVTDHREGQRLVLGPSWRMARAPARITRGAPALGEDDAYLLHEILTARVSADVARPAGDRR